jgi:hypothetical protein
MQILFNKYLSIIRTLLKLDMGSSCGLNGPSSAFLAEILNSSYEGHMDLSSSSQPNGTNMGYLIFGKQPFLCLAE